MATIPSALPHSNVGSIRQRIDRQWLDRIDRFARHLEAAWQRFSEDFDAARAETLEAEELAPLFAAFSRLRRLGVRFDPRFIARMDALKGEAEDLNVDGDADASDELLDLEDSDEDGSDEACEDGWGNHHTLAPGNGGRP
jgi:hypothetical protein